MKLHHRIEQNICILAIEGDLSSKNMNEIEPYLAPFLQETKSVGIIINFENIPFVDSSGVGLILSVYKTLQAQESRLVLCQLNEENKKIFEMTRLDNILPIYATEQKAVTSFSKN